MYGTCLKSEPTTQRPKKTSGRRDANKPVSPSPCCCIFSPCGPGIKHQRLLLAFEVATGDHFSQPLPPWPLPPGSPHPLPASPSSQGSALPSSHLRGLSDPLLLDFLCQKLLEPDQTLVPQELTTSTWRILFTVKWISRHQSVGELGPSWAESRGLFSADYHLPVEYLSQDKSSAPFSLALSPGIKTTLSLKSK